MNTLAMDNMKAGLLMDGYSHFKTLDEIFEKFWSFKTCDCLAWQFSKQDPHFKARVLQQLQKHFIVIDMRENGIFTKRKTMNKNNNEKGE